MHVFNGGCILRAYGLYFKAPAILLTISVTDEFQDQVAELLLADHADAPPSLAIGSTR